MKVTLLAHTPEPEKIVASAAKLCYSSSDIETLMDNLNDDKIEKFIKKLTDLGHQSPLEHCSFTFGIEGISRCLTHQLVRHRLASYSQKSQRYVKEEQFEYIVPPAIRDNEEAVKLYEQNMYSSHFTYKTLIDLGISPEDARFVLPNACETKIVMTMNIRELLHFFNERCCNRAQWEIRAMADEMLAICKNIAPNIFAKAGASCVRGKCKEGQMSCGKPRKEVD